jgi:hypothetical protein
MSMLFPASAVTPAAGRGGAGPGRSFAVVPSASHPRLLVPLAPRGAAAAALRAYGGRLSTRDRLAYRGLGAALGASGPGLLSPYLTVAPAPPGDVTDIDTHLSDVLGAAVSVAVHLTPARANRKPIVQALTADSRYPVAFAKVAENDLTATLVGQEADALARVAAAGSDGIVVPQVLSSTPVGGRAALVMRPLPTWSRGSLPDSAQLARGLAAVAALAPVSAPALGESGFWLRLRADIEAVGQAAARDALRRVADDLEAVAANAEISVGASHGDWSPWNMWQTPRGLLVWDWERFTTDVPLGSDLVHYRLQELLVMNSATPLVAARAALQAAPRPIVGALHLLRLAARYDKDNQAATGSARRSDEWLLPVVDAAIHDRSLLAEAAR